MTSDQLKKEYANAQGRITEIYKNTKAPTTVTYKAKTTEQTDKVFEDLHTFTTEYCDSEIEKIYEDSLEQLELDVYEEYGIEEDWHYDRVRQEDTVSHAKENAESSLFFALMLASACLGTYSNNADRATGFNINDVSGFKESMLLQIAEHGIQGSAYFREGTIVNGSLSSYANAVLEGVNTSVGNGAVLDGLITNGWDLVQMSEHYGACGLCIPYQGRVYSLSGMSDEYPYLYETGWSEEYQSFHPNCRHYIEPFFPDSVPPEKLGEIIEYSNRSYTIGGTGWTKEQTEKAQRDLKLYEKGQEKKHRIYEAKKQYEKYKAVVKDTPKTFKQFWNMKQANSEAYHNLKAEYRASV